MSEQEKTDSIGEKAGYYLGYIIGFLIIGAIGLVILWITMEPYH